jgi:hypothetical protein
MRAAVFGEIVHHENPRAVEMDFSRHPALAVLGRHPQRFGGAKCLYIEFDRGVGVVDGPAPRRRRALAPLSLRACLRYSRWSQ